jgi:hypothetical protein
MSNGTEKSAAAFAGLLAGFRPGVQYSEAMDCAIYLKEDCSYVVARVSPKLSLLLDPYNPDKAVGVKIKGVQHLVEQLLSILAPEMDDHRIELSQLLRMAIVTEEEAERALSEAEAARRKELANRAKQFLKDEEHIMFEIPERMAA